VATSGRPAAAGSLSAAGRDTGRAIYLGFLGGWPFRRKNPDLEHWISLDFLGFSRPNRDFSMGYAGFSRESFSHALFAG
jgi:hypothetical protein